MSRITELIDCMKIYNLCNHCDHFKCGECSVDNVNCKEEIEKQIISEIKADVIDEVSRAMYHQCFECNNDEDMQKWDSGNWIRYKLFENVIGQLKEQNNDSSNLDNSNS